MSELKVDKVSPRSGNYVALNTVGMKNIVINGDMSIAQRSTSVASITASGYYTLDRWQTAITTLGTWTQSQDTDVPTGYGFATSLKMDCTTADATPSANDVLFIAQKFEGQNLQYLKKGTANAESLTLSFWVKSNKTGTYIVGILDSDNTRNIANSYTINSANTWEKKTITFAGDTTGTLDNDNSNSLQIEFYLGAGSTYTSGSLPTSWETRTNADRAVGQVNLADDTANEWYITGVQLEAGTTASDFEFLPVDVNLDRCQRYFQAPSKGIEMQNYVFSCYAGTSAYGNFGLIKSMRASPSITFNSLGVGNIQGYNNNNEITLSTISLAYASTDRVGITLTGSGWSGGQAMHVNNNNTSVPLFTASAEL
jgi:hypothetical protein